MRDPMYDIEDLLKDAAEHYPLKDPEDGWDGVAARLSNVQVISVVKAKSKNRRRKFLLLFILLFLAITALTFIVWNKDNGPAVITTSLPVTHQVDANLVDNRLNSQPLTPKPEKTHGQTGTNSPFIPDQQARLNHSNLPGHASGVNLSRAATLVQQPESAIKRPLIRLDKVVGAPEFFEATPTVFDSATKSPLDRLQSDKATSNKPARNTEGSSFYFGIAGGPAFSNVRNDGFHKMGYEVGLSVGYRFNDKWSLETGILFAQKYYWVRKENFDTKQFNAAMPQGMELLEVHGSNCLLQVPLHVRYDFLEKKKYRFFATAGVSSSLMVVEHNDYTTRYNGGINKIDINYGKNKPYFASNVDLSAGVEYRLNNRFGIRIGPYYQMPLKNLGVGLVPVTTVGLRLGIVTLPY